MELMNPCGAFDVKSMPLAPRVDLGPQTTVGLFANDKKNADVLLEERIPHHLLGHRGTDGVRFITVPEDLIVLVSGGAGRHSAVLPTFGGSTQAVSRRIE